MALDHRTVAGAIDQLKTIVTKTDRAGLLIRDV
jgi:hypothetical protein